MLYNLTITNAEKQAMSIKKETKMSTKTTWLGKNLKMHEAETRPEKLAAHLYNYCHGSGLNYDFEFYKKGSVLTTKTYWQYMNDAGYYERALPVTIRIDWHEMELINVRVRNTGKYFGLKDELEDRVSSMLASFKKDYSKRSL